MSHRSFGQEDGSDDKVATKKKLAAIEKEIIEQIDQAVAFAKEAEFPAIEEMYEDVYVTEGVK